MAETAIQKKQDESMQIAKALDGAASNGLLAQKETSQFLKSFMLADSIDALRNLLTPKVMERFMRLQNTTLGFKTDQPTGYPPEVVRECLISAALQGVYPVGNQFNIIAGNCYITKEGMGQLLKNIGMKYMITPLATRFEPPMAKQPMEIVWEWNGKTHKQVVEFQVRFTENMAKAGVGVDAVIGKATRKARAWLYLFITGLEVKEGDASERQAIDITPPQQEASPLEQKPAQADATDIPPMQKM